MNKTPDWLVGGDPLRTVWTSGRDRLSMQGIQWIPLGEWVDGVHELSLESGTAANGTVTVVRLRGVIMDTARELSGEFGWCFSENQMLEIPVIIPSKWSEPWRSWLYGYITVNQLFSKLGLAMDCADEGGLIFKTTASQLAASKKSNPSFLVAGLASAVVIGFALGWLAKRSPEIPANRTLPQDQIQSSSEAEPLARPDSSLHPRELRDPKTLPSRPPSR